jgi:hypothetical protein
LLREIEHETRDESGEITEENRVSLIKIHVNIPNRRMILEYFRTPSKVSCSEKMLPLGKEVRWGGGGLNRDFINK